MLCLIKKVAQDKQTKKPKLHIRIFYILSICSKERLKIRKGQSEAVNRRKTDNTMANRTGTKGQTTIYKIYTENYKSSNTNPTKTGDELMCSGTVSSSCSTRGTRHVTLVINPVISHK